MSRARFFLTQEPFFAHGEPVLLPLTDEDARHASRVLRVELGEELDLVTPIGTVWRAEVTQVSRDGVWARSIEVLDPVWHPRISLFQGLAKGEKMDAIVRQAVEVGAHEVVPVVTSRTVVRLDDKKRHERGERWRRIAQAAAKQARRDAVPHVADPVDFEDAFALFSAYDGALVLWEDHKGRMLSAAVRTWTHDKDARVALFVGPEGGLSAAEVAALEEVGAVTVSLGPSILRTETAAVVGIALAVAAAYEAVGQ